MIRWLLVPVLLGAPAFGSWAWWSGWPRGINSLARARAAYDRGDWEAAKEFARERLKSAGDDPDAERLLARAWFRLHRDDSGAAIFGRLGPSNLEAEDLCVLGQFLSRSGKTASALEVWQIGRTRDPQHAEILFELTRAYLASDRLDDAVRTGVELGRRPGWESRAEALLGAIYLERNDPARTIEYWHDALERPRPTVRAERVPWPIVPRVEYARALLRVNHTDEAREQLELALAAGPDEEASWLLSRVALQRKDWAEARAEIGRSGSFREAHPMQPEPAPYVGTSTCVGCHTEEFRAQQASRHARTFSRANELGGLGIPSSPVPDPVDPSVVHTFRRDAEGGIHQETRTAGKVFEAVVQYAFGSGDRGVTMVGRDPAGQAYELRLSGYPETHGKGPDARIEPHWDVTSGHVPKPNRPERYLGEPLPENRVRRCLICHVTDPEQILQGKGPCAADRSIGCERCHGPGGNHLLAVEGDLAEIDPAIARPSMAAGPRVVQLCAECHAPRGQEVPRDDPTAARFQAATLTWSRCYIGSNGQMDCITCHNPHRNASTSAAHYEARCLECHSRADGQSRSTGATSTAPRPSSRRGIPDIANRTVCPVNPSNGCIDCHMPAVKGVVPHSTFTDHFIRVHRD